MLPAYRHRAGLEPDHRDPELYLANTFSYAQRRDLAEHAYQQTRQMLRSRKTGLTAKLARHGITTHEALDDPNVILLRTGQARNPRRARHCHAARGDGRFE